MSTKLIPQEQIDDAMLILAEWNIEDNDVGQLTKELEFDIPQKAFELIAKLGELSKNNEQTPDILMHSNGKFVEIMITDYEYEGITQECLDLAFEIDGIL
jgi:pterin-4a-carbinolamine dehydratase